MIEHVFAECGIMVQEIEATNPQTGEKVKIRRLTVHDPASGQVFHYAMDEDQARKVGGQLMGLGNVEVPTVIPPEFGNLKDMNGKRR